LSSASKFALIGPLARQAPAGFLFYGGGREELGETMDLDFKKLDGLVPAVIQDAGSDEVLMLGFMNAEAYAATQSTGEVTFFSRSRNKLWRKGEQSGHVLKVREIRVDCDVDALLIRVDALGPGVCHEGYRSCFFRQLSAAGEAKLVGERTFDPKAVYGKDAR
jgi:phosphoribosyl-AMP cyclohydrolase